MKPRCKGKQYLIIVFTLLLAVSYGTVAVSAPPPTQFMPGFPIMAGETIMVMWLPVPGAVKYVLYMNDKKVAEGPAPPLQVPTPTEGGNYNLQIAAVDASGAEGPKSAPSTIKIVKLEPPKELEARYMGGNVALRWKGTPAAVIYNVFRSEEKGKNYQLIVSTQMAQYVDSNPPKNKNYFYVVTSKDIAGKESAYSAEVAVSTKIEEAKVSAGQVTNAMKMIPTQHKTEYLFFGSQTLMAPVDIVGVDGKLFVANGATGVVTVIDEASGDFIKAFGGMSAEPADAKAGAAFGIGADRRGRIYLCAGSKVVVFNQEGNALKVINKILPTDEATIEAGKQSYRGRIPEVFYYDMAEAADGSILVVDNGFGRVLVFDPDTFELKSSFGKYGTMKPLEFNHPGFIGVNKAGDIWINDSMNRRGQVLKKDYTLKFIAGEAKTFVGAFLGMGGISLDADGNWVITDPPMVSIQVFDAATGKYKHHLADVTMKVDESTGQRPSWNMTNPSGIWIDAPKKLLFITSPQTGEVLVRQILDTKGGEKEGGAK